MPETVRTTAREAVHEPEAPARFRVRGHEFELDVLDTVLALRDLAAGLGEKATHKDYLEGIVGHIEEHTGISLTHGEADWLADKLEELYASLKKKRADALRGTLT